MKLFIFDWDGTVIDSNYGMSLAVQAAAVAVGFEAPTPESIHQHAGKSLKATWEGLFGRISAEQQAELDFVYSKKFVESMHERYLFEGIIDLITQLNKKGALCAVATGKSYNGLINEMQTLGHISHLFATVRTADRTASKPDPDMLEEILTELDIPKQQAIMIGDSSQDMLMAQALGMDTVGVTYGITSDQGKEGLLHSDPTYICSSIADLRSLLISLVA